MKTQIIKAIVKRELASYFSSPTGYVFITIFIFLSAFAAFWLPGFFGRNLASLDQLNAWFPALLLMLVPAITMGAWAEERKQGTEELLLTLPANDWDLVLGKYLACVLIYTAALVFSLSHVVVLAWLGRPDLGLMASTYLGYWLAGAGLIAIGMIGSALTSNLTVAFIVSAVLCGGLVGIGSLSFMAPGSFLASVAEGAALPSRLEDFGRGVVSAENVAYFALMALFGLWANTVLVSKRHWSGARDSTARGALAFVRGGAVLVAAGALVVLCQRTTVRADATAERLWSLSEETRKIVRQVAPERPVLVTAYVSPRVPSSFIQTRETLLGLLRELDRAEGGSRIAVRVVDTEPYTEAAREARKNFNIESRPVPGGEQDADGGVSEVFMGVAFTCGAEQLVLPFLSRGLPVEYELARAIRTVSLAGRKKVGILETEAGLFGSFDFQTFQSREDWPIIEELRKQYEVVRVEKGAMPPVDLDVLIVPQPSTLTELELAMVVQYIKSGKGTLIFEDPLPMVNPGLATSEPRGANQNPFQRQRQPQQEPKANMRPLWDLLGCSVPGTRVMWDGYNPRPQYNFEREIVFVGRGAGNPAAINDQDEITSGLQEVVMMLSGEVEQPAAANARPAGLSISPLLKTSLVSGFVNYSDVLQRGFMGVQGFNRGRKQIPTAGDHVLAAHITGVPAAPIQATPAPAPAPVANPGPPQAEEGQHPAPPPTAVRPAAPPAMPAPAPVEAKPLNVVLVADLDIVSPEFFRLREMGVEQFNFDNVTFVLNAVDTLAGDQSLVELRKRRPMYRTLEKLDEARRTLEIRRNEAVEKATGNADAQLALGKANLEKKVAEIEKRTDLDDTTRGIMIESVRQAEQRRLDVQTATINDRKEAEINEARTRAKEEIDRVQNQIRFAAVLLPPIPALALGTIVFMRRRGQESEGVARERLR